MDINLPEADIRKWAKQLDHQFNNLRDHFGPEIHRDELFKALSTLDDGGGLRLKEIRTGADVLHAVQCCISLAVRKPNPSDSINLKESAQLPILETQKDGPSTTLNPIYSDVQLVDRESQVRLIKLLPGRLEDPLKINLFVVNSVSSQPYEALSYVWGSRDADVSLEVNGEPFDVALNLAEALHCLKPSEDEDGRVLWVDAICINQSDDLEKSAQVSLMGDIYRNAAEVLIFLGEERDNSAMVMQYLDLEDIEDVDEGKSQVPAIGGSVSQMTQTEIGQDSIVQARIQRCGFQLALFLHAADAFFKRPWWFRVWTVQEFALSSKDPKWHCGRTWTSTAHMRDRIGNLFGFLINQAIPLQGDPALVVDVDVNVETELVKMAERRWNLTKQLLKRQHLGFVQRPFQFMVTLLYRQSTDPRDRIYAVRELLEPVSKHVFAPDYTAPVEDIFLKLETYLLGYDQFGHIYDLYELSRSADVPSWALDFTKALSQHAVWHLSWYMDRAPWAKSVGHLSIYNHVLSIPGVEIDNIDTIAPFEKESDLRRLGMFWKLEGHMQKRDPEETLPESAVPFIPSNCLIPFTSLREHFDSLGSESVGTQFPTTPKIPGFLRFRLETLKLQLAQKPPMCDPKNLTCEKWDKAASLVGYEQLYGRLNRIIAAAAEASIAESFLGGACFDLPNMKAQIMSVTLPEHDTHNPINDRTPTDLNNPQDHGTQIPGIGSYIPQYIHIKEVLLQAKNQQELDVLKTYACTLAEGCCSIVADHLAKQGLSSTQIFAELRSLSADYHNTHVFAYRDLSEKCLCEGEKKTAHQDILNKLMDATQQSKLNAEAYVANDLDHLKMEGYDPSTELYMTVRRLYTGMFITKLGFVGASFQPQHGFKRGDKVVVLDGIPTPMVLEETEESDTYRMKAAAHVVGFTHINIDKLVEVGVCKRRRFKIV